MPKKRIDNRLDQLFEGIKQEETVAPPSSPVTKKPARSTPRPEPVTRPEHPARTERPKVHGTGMLPSLDSISLADAGSSGAPSTLAVAFPIDQHNWATLQIVDEKRKAAWDDEEKALVKQVTDQLTLALENAHLFQETQKRAEELAVLNEMARSLSSLLDVTEIGETINRYAIRLIGATSFYMALFNQPKNEITFPVVYEEGTRKAWKSRQFGQGLTEKIIQSGETLLIQDHVTDRLKDLGIDVIGREAKCWLGVPMHLGTQTIGIIAAQDFERPNAFDLNSQNLLEAMSSQAVIAIENARLFQETQQALSEVQQQQRLLNTVINSTPDWIFIKDKDHKLQLANQAYADSLKRPIDEVLGKDDLELGFPEEMVKGDPDKGIVGFWPDDVEVLEKGETKNVPEEPLLLDDGMHYLSTIKVPLKDISGQSWGVLGFVHDITNRKRAEETIRENETLLRTIIDSTLDWIYIRDSDHHYRLVNKSYAESLKLTPQDVIGKDDLELGFSEETVHGNPEKGIAGLWADDQEVMQSGQIKIVPEEPSILEGRERFISTVKVPLKDISGQVWGVLGFVHDITDIKKAEDALRRQNEYLAASTEIARLVSSTLDLDIIFNRTVNLIRDRLGFYHVAIFIVEETGFNSLLREATGDAGREMKERGHSLAVGSKSIVGQVSENGEQVIVNDVGLDPTHKPNPLLPDTKAEAGIPLRIGSRVIGVLDLQATMPNAFTENDLAVLQTLADQVAIAIDNARSYDLAQQAVKEMRELDQLKSQFLANMSHELRTPLNSIIGFSRVILKGIDGPISELQQQDLMAIYNSGQHLLGLINDVLDLSRIEAGKMELTFDDVNIGDLIKSTMSTLTGLVKDKPVKIVQEVAEDIPIVRADPMRVRQVLINLFSNASKFTDEGAITVRAKMRKGLAGQQELWIGVTDTGPGISAEDQKKLFQAFSQVDSSPTRKTGGSGLGLSICHHLIQMHGGQIGVDSEVGKGSTFYFTLPVQGNDKPEPSQEGKIVMAIDDDQQVISLYERYLNPQGYRVVAVTDPLSARERAKQLKPFAITLDVMMPGCDGWTVIQDLKSDPETRTIPVIICSIVEDEEKGYTLGAADYLVKPILEDTLVQAIDRLNADGSIREVLVIDDDDDDLRLIGKMLADDGRYKAVLAQGGKQGWEIIESKPPHAIILDLFMPEMDGFSILEKMRASPELRDIPAVVVTGGDLTPEQNEQINSFGRRLLQKSALSKNELAVSIERALKRVATR
jgi:PAS domain S-box-containing protein